MDYKNAYDEIVYISSSDEEMEVGGWSSSEDEYEEDEEIQKMAFCVEKALEKAGTVAGRVMTVEIPIEKKEIQMPGPSTQMTEMGKFPTLHYELGRGNGPIERSAHIRANHPIELCGQLTPAVDSPQSPPPHEKYPPASNFSSQATVAPSSCHPLDDMASHFQRMGISEPVDKPMFSDCLVCGKTTEQIQDEAVIDYLHQTAIPGESAQQFNSRRLAFLVGMRVGMFLLVPGGVSQAAACDGNLYSIIPAGEQGKALPNTVPLKWRSRDEQTIEQLQRTGLHETSGRKHGLFNLMKLLTININQLL